MFHSSKKKLSTIFGSICLILLLSATSVFGLITTLRPTATAAPNEYINFQARLQNSAGAIVPDGNYNIEFKLYDVDSGGSALWTETRTGVNRVRVVNGYMTANLGSVTPFGTSFDWSTRHWLTMNIGGTGGVASWDGEMNPRLLLTAVPYAFKAANVASGSTNSASTNSSNVSITSGNATGTTSNSGNIDIDAGTATGTTGTISLGATNASSLLLGRSGLTTAIQGGVSVAENAAFNGNTTIGSDNTDTVTFNSVIQGTDALVFEGATADGFETTLQIQDPTADVTYRFATVAAGTYDICTTQGNCSGTGGGVTTPGGTANRLAMFSAGQTIADSWLNQNSSTLELDSTRNLSLLGGNLSVTGTGTFSGLVTLNGGLTVETGDVFTLNGEGFTDLTGDGLTFSSGSLQTTLGTSVDLTTEVTGILPIANGGTGASTAAGARTNLGAAASGANGDITSTTALNTITPSGALTIGATGQSFTLQGDSSSVFTVTSGSFTSTYKFTTPTATGTYDICTTEGNCSGVGGGVTTPGGTANRLAVFTGSGSIADSWLNQNSSTLELDSTRNLSLLGGNLSVTGTGTFSGLVTLNGGLTVETGDTFTFNGDAFTDLTGTGLTINAGVLEATLGASVDLTTEVTGVLPIANGGTNASTAQGAINNLSGLTSQGDLLYHDGTNATRLVRGDEGECLTSNGTTVVWGNCVTAQTTLFTLQGTSGTPQIISGSDTVTIAAGSNITTTAGATDTLTVALVNNPTFSGLLTANGGLTIETGDTFTFNGEGFTDLTGDGLTLSGTTLAAVLGSSVDLTTEVAGILPIANGGTGASSLNDLIALGTHTTGDFVAGNTAGAGIAVTGTAGEGWSPIIALDYSSTLAANVLAANQSSFASTGLLFEGTTADGFETLLTSVDPTADRTINLPDESGTVCLQNSANCGFALSGSGVTSLNALTGALTIQGNAQVAVNASSPNISLSIQNDSIGDTQLAFNTGQHLTTTSNPTFNDLTVSGTLGVTGASTFTGLVTANGGLTIEAGDTFTFNSDAFTDLTGTGLTVSSGALQTTLGISVDLTAEVDGILPVANGGTGASTLNDLITLGTHTTGDFAAGNTAGTGIAVTGTTGEGWSPTISLDYASTLAANTLASSQSSFASTGLLFEGTTADGFETLIDSTDPTADRTITLPDESGTICLQNSANCGFALAGSGVTSLNGLAGAVVIQGNAQITVDVSSPNINLSITADSIGDTQLAFNTGQHLTSTSSPTFNGLTLTSLTMNSDSFTDLTGTGLTISSGVLEATLGTSVDLTTEVTGILPIANGGTGASTLNDLITLGTHTTGDFVSGNTAGTGIAITGSTGEGWSPVVSLDYSGTLASNSLGANLSSFAATGLLFEGTTADSFETLINSTDPTADNTITLPDESGTICLQNSANCGFALAGSGVTSLNGLAGALSIQGNAQITVNASTPNISLSITADSIGDGQLAFDTGQHLTSTSSPTFNGLTLTSLTINADSFTDLTGTGLTINSGVLETTLGTSVDLTTEVTGILPIANGGTGASTLNDLISLSTHTTGDYVANNTAGTGIAITGTAGEGWSPVVSLDYASTLASNSLGADLSSFASTGLLFEGSVADGFETLLTSINPTADRTVNLPDESGTVCIQGSTACGFAAAGSGVTSLNSLTGALSVQGNAQITVNASSPNISLSITADSIGDSQLAFNTGQHLTTTSNPTFNDLILDGTLAVTGTSTFTGLLTANGGLTVETGDTFTVNGEGFTDLTGTGLTLSGSSLATTLGTSIDLTSEVTGTLPIANGGTNSTTTQGAINNLSGLTTQGDLLYHDGTNSTRLARGNDGQCLTSNTTTITWGSCVNSTTSLFTIQGTSGTPQAINGGDTVTIAAGSNVTTTASATDTVTVAIVNNPTFSGLLTANGGLTVETGDTLTFNGEAFTDLTGTGLILSGSSLTTTLGTSIDLTSEVTSILPVANGGTGASTLNDLITLGTHTTGNFVAGNIAGAGIAITGSAGEGWSPTIALDYSGTLAVNALTANQSSFASTGLLFEGTTADGFETLIDSTDPTADRTITLPDESGTVCIQGSTACGFVLAGVGVDTLNGLSGDLNILGNAQITVSTSSPNISLSITADSIGDSQLAFNTGQHLTTTSSPTFNGLSLSSTLDVTGNSTLSGTAIVTGLTTLNGGLTVETGDTFTFNGDAFTDLTGTGLAINAGVLEATLGTSVDLASEVTGLLPIANGGTNASTAQAAINNLSGLTTNGDLLYHNGTNSTRLARGADGECLTANATTIAWGNCLTASTTLFTLQGSSGTPQTINGLDTVTIAAGNNITTTAGATDTITVATVNNPNFTTSVTTPLLTSSAGLNITGGTTLTLSSTGAGNDIVINGADILDIQDNTTFAGSVGVTGLTTLNGGLTVETGDTFTFNGDAFTDLTGTGLTINAGVLEATLGTSIDLTSEVTGILPVANGGTGANTFTAGAILLGNGTSAIGNTGVLASGQLLIGDGTGAPTISTLTAGSDISITNGAGSITIAVSESPAFTTSVTTPLLTSSGSLTLNSALGTNIIINGGNILDIQDNTTFAGSVGVTGLTTLNGGLTIETGDTFTFNGDAFTDLTGTGLTISGGVLQTTLGTSIDLATEVTGVLPVANGGTGANSLNDLISLSTHTTGNYVATLGALTGLSTTGNTGEGSTPTLSVLYGSAADTAVEGDTSISVSSGTNLTGGGSIVLGAGGTVTLNVADNPTFAGLVTANGGLSVQTGDTFTMNGDAFTDLTGTGLTIIGGALQSTLGTSVDLTAEVSGTLPIGSGGTGANTAQTAINNISGLTTNGDLLYHNGTNSTRLARGSTGQCLTSNGTTIAWGTCATSSSTFFTLQGSSGTPQAISGGDTVTIAAGSNLTTTASATDTVTIAIVSNPSFTTSVTTPLLTSSAGLNVTGGTTLTLSSTGAGNDIIINGADILDVQDNTVFAGTVNVNGAATLNSLTTSGLVTANGGLTVETGDTFTFNGDAFTDLTGTGLTISSGALQTTLGTSVDLTSEVTGLLPVGSGGTNASTAQGAINNISGLTTQGDLLYHDGTNATRLARGADGECLTANATTILWGPCAVGITGLNLAATSGTPQALGDNDTITIAAGTNTSTTIGGTDTVTVAVVDNPTFSGLVTAQAGLTITTGQSLTVGGDAFTDLTGAGLTISGGTLQTTLGTSVDLTSEVSGTLPIGSGGTGATSSQTAINNLSQLTTNGDLLYHNGTNSTRLARGSTGQCLTSSGTTVAWGTCATSSSTFFTIQGTSGTPQAINGGDTVTIAAGSNVTTTASATDTVTVAIVNNPTFSGLLTANGGLTVETGDTLTFNGEAFTDLTGTGLALSSGALGIDYSSTLASNSLAAGQSIFGSGGLLVEGATADGFEWLIGSPSNNPTADRTLELPDLSGTLAVVNANQTFSGSQTFSGTFSTTSTTLLGNDSNDRLTITSQILGTAPLVFQGTTDDSFETSFAFVDPTADRTITFPNTTGTVALLDVNQTFTNTQTFSGVLSTTGTTVLGDAETDNLTLNASIQGSTAMIFEGATLDGNKTYLNITDPTIDRTITLPNANGTLAVSASGNIGLDSSGNISFTGTLPISSGGTGATTQQAAINNLAGLSSEGDLLYHNGTNAFRLSRGTTGQCLTSTSTTVLWGSCANPSTTFFTLAASTGTPQPVNGGDTVTLSAGSNISTVASATDLVSISVVSNPTFGGLVTAQAGLTVSSSQSLTINGEAVTDLTGNGLSIVSGALSVDTSGANGFFTNGGNAFTANSVLGNTGSYDLTFITNNTARLTVTASGNILVGTSDTTGTLLVVDTKTDSGDPGGLNGAIYYNSNSGKFRCYQNGIWRNCIGALVNVNTSADTVNSTAVETNFATNYVIAANTCTPGRVFRITAQGTWGSSGGSHTLNIRFKIGSTVLNSTGDIAIASNINNAPIRFEYQITCITNSSTGTVEASGEVRLYTNQTTFFAQQMLTNASTVGPIDFTTNQTLQISADWGTSHVNNTITMRQIIFEDL